MSDAPREQGNRATGQQRATASNRATAGEAPLGDGATLERDRGRQGGKPGDDIAARLVRVGAAVVGVVESLPRSRAGRHIGDQLLRSGTAGGAHHGEARAAESRADFVHKVRLGAKELREAIYWLRVVQQAGLSTRPGLGQLIGEIDQLVAILITSARTARAKCT